MVNYYEIPVEYISGHIRDAILDVCLTNEEVDEYNKLSTDDERREYLEDKGDIIVTDFRTNDWSLDTSGHKKLKRNGE